MTLKKETVIIGAGTAGLVCARTLQEAGVEAVILEASSSIGGRLKTNLVDGFRLDHGFQVLQLAYPEAQRSLDYDMLDLKPFPPGASFRYGGRFHILADPIRQPAHMLDAVLFPLGNLSDRMKLLRLAREVCRMDIRDLFEGEELMARDYLELYGFSEEMIERFFIPFLAGICLDPRARVTQRFMLFVLRMFAQGDVALPALGMNEIPRQIGSSLAEDSIYLDHTVSRIIDQGVVLEDGTIIEAETVVLATPESETIRLLGGKRHRDSCQEYCFYYEADEAPVSEPFLMLNGEGKGLINSVTFPSLVAPDYAPAGKTLVAAIVPGYYDISFGDIQRQVRQELITWFGAGAEKWRSLEAYHIQGALPRPVVPSPNPYQIDPHVRGNLFSCSEYSSMPSIQWALHSGVTAAHAVANYLDAKKPAFC